MLVQQNDPHSPIYINLHQFTALLGSKQEIMGGLCHCFTIVQQQNRERIAAGAPKSQGKS
jgi:hypothetical protein